MCVCVWGGIKNSLCARVFFALSFFPGDEKFLCFYNVRFSANRSPKLAHLLPLLRTEKGWLTASGLDEVKPQVLMGAELTILP